MKIIRMTFILLLCAVILCELSPVLANGHDIPDGQAFAGSPNVKIIFGSMEVAFENPPLIIENTAYVPIRDFSENIPCEISWDTGTRTVSIKTENRLITFCEPAGRLSVNDTEVPMPKQALNIGNHIYIPVRAITSAFGKDLIWNAENRAVIITEPVNYSADDLYWLSRIIHAESQGESLEGKIAVGNVVLNRVNSEEFPDTVRDVIFDSEYGVQFTPTATGSIYSDPDEESISAAKMCLSGYSISKDIVYFLNERIATSKWIVQNKTFAFAIGAHSFYMN